MWFYNYLLDLNIEHDRMYVFLLLSISTVTWYIIDSMQRNSKLVSDKNE